MEEVDLDGDVVVGEEVVEEDADGLEQEDEVERGEDNEQAAEDVGLNCLPAENVDGDDVENDAR